MIAAELVRALVAEAALAPSVHNVQPARWRFADGGVTLFEDMGRRLPAGDPEGRDAATSLGAAAEGMAIACAGHGLKLIDRGPAHGAPEGDLRPVRAFAIEPGGTADPLGRFVAGRRSWRGPFAPPTKADGAAAHGLAGEDAIAVADADGVAEIAELADPASLGFLRDPGFREELRGWMRLSRRDPRWARDGLNAEAMAMSRIEAIGAGLVLGPLFRPLDAIGLAAPLTGEAATIRGSAGVLLFHRPAGEDRFESGRAFHRLWLRVTAAGLDAAVMAALADDAGSAAALAARFGVPASRTLVSTMRIGRAPAGAAYPRARLAVEELLV